MKVKLGQRWINKDYSPIFGIGEITGEELRENIKMICGGWVSFPCGSSLEAKYMSPDFWKLLPGQEVPNEA